MSRVPVAITAVALVVSLVTSPAFAGTQLLCRQYDIGDETSLPWKANTGWGEPAPGYAREQVVADTLKLLTPERPVLVRMETLRRAAQYTQRNLPLQRELMAALMARVLEAESRSSADARAWFDAGYLASTFELSREPVPIASVDGYRWIQRALALRAEPEMHFAAALIHFEMPDKPGPHLTQAFEGAKPGSPLARNLTIAYGDKRPVRNAARD
jgi:hypothetical protein